jgi:hypothetical protein
VKHDWQSGPYHHKFEAMGITRRTCKICGKVQQLIEEQTWGRITGRRWMPLVGRCKPKGKTK